MTGEDTRNAIKLAARRLFAVNGIDGVSVRDIVAAAGQRNSGSLHYYFRTKEALIRELVVDGARIIDDRRNARLDAIARAGLRPSLRDVVSALVWPSIDLGGEDGEEDSYIRFIGALQTSRRALFLEALEGRWASGYQRCLAEIRALLPGIPPAILNQRLVFMGLAMGATLSARERALAGRRPSHQFWAAPHTMDNLIDTIVALLSGPVSEQTTATLAAATHPAEPPAASSTAEGR